MQNLDLDPFDQHNSIRGPAQLHPTRGSLSTEPTSNQNQSDHPLMFIFCGIAATGISTILSKLVPTLPNPNQRLSQLSSGQVPLHRPLEYKHHHRHLRIIDLPGFLCAHDAQEARNHANIQLLLSSTSNDNCDWRHGQTVVLYCYPAINIRMVGPASTFRQSLRILKSHNIVKSRCADAATTGQGQSVNVIVVVTNTSPSTSTEVIKFMEESFRKGFREEFDLRPNESAEIPIIFLENREATPLATATYTEDQTAQQIMSAIKTLLGPSGNGSIQALSTPTPPFLQIQSDEPTEDTFAKQHEKSVQFLRLSKLIGPAPAPAPNRRHGHNSLADADGAEQLITYHIGQGIELSNPSRYINLCRCRWPCRPTVDLQLGTGTESRIVQVPKAYTCKLTQPDLDTSSVHLASADHKKKISWYTFHVRMLEMVIENPADFLKSCDSNLADSLQLLSAGYDSETFFRKWGTHLVVAEEQGGFIQILVTWQYLIRKPGDKLRATVGKRLEEYLQLLLRKETPKLELPSNATLHVFQLQEPDGPFKSFTEKELSPGIMGEWVKTLHNSPMYLRPPVPVAPSLSNASGPGSTNSCSCLPWLVHYSELVPSSPQERQRLATEMEEYYARLNRGRFDPRGWVRW